MYQCCILILLYTCFFHILLHGDIETNPGPQKKKKNLCCCHWNVKAL